MPASTAYGIDLLVELAVGRATDAGRWGQSEWGRSTWGTSDTTLGDWLDVTCDVLDGVRLSAGSNTDDGVSRRWESASAGLTLDGSQWDPWNGPHRNVIGDRTPIRISWRAPLALAQQLTAFGLTPRAGAGGWTPAFTGFIATRGYDWNPSTQQATVACVDGTSVLVSADAPTSPLQGANESASERVSRILTSALWPGATDITAGGTLLQGTTLDKPAWEELLEVADTDIALLWVDRAGALAFRPRGRVGQGVALSGRLVVCEEGPDDIAVMTMGRNQPTVTRNRIAIARKKDDTITNDAPVVATLEDRQSVERYQPHNFTRTDLLHVDDTWSATVAQAVLGAGAWPSPAPGLIALDSDSGDERIGPLLLTLEPDMTFDVVDDGESVYRQAVVGWDIQVTNQNIEGVLQVEDVTRWTNVAHWGTALWGVDRWGIGGL